MGKVKKKIGKKSKPSKSQAPLRLEYVDPRTLDDNPENWRRHPEKQMAALGDVLNDPEIGWAGACLWNSTTNRLVDGHARKKKAIEMGLDAIPVLIGSWSPEAEKKILVTLDPLASMATHDTAQLRALLEEVEFDTPALGDLEADLRKMMGELPAELERAEEDTVELKKFDTRRPPKMAWVLIGIPTVRLGEITPAIDQISEVEGIMLEVTANDGPGKARKEKTV